MNVFGFGAMTGIDIGAGSIKIARIKPGKRPVLTAAGIIDLPVDGSQDDLGVHLARLCAEKKVRKGSIATQLPGRDITIRSLTLPKMPLDELGEAVRWESKKHISYPVDSAMVEFLITGERQEAAVDKYDILMVAAEKEKVISHLAPFSKAGLEVAAVDSNALALRNVLRNREQAPAGNIVVIDIGAGKTEIDIFSGTVLRFSRCLETGGADMTRMVAESMNVPLPRAEDLKRAMSASALLSDDPGRAAVRVKIDALLMEIRRSVEYYKSTFREKEVERAILTGGLALMQGIADYFSDSLGIPVEIDDPLAGLNCIDELRERLRPVSPRLSAVIGLALRRG